MATTATEHKSFQELEEKFARLHKELDELNWDVAYLKGENETLAKIALHYGAAQDLITKEAPSTQSNDDLIIEEKITKCEELFAAMILEHSLTTSLDATDFVLAMNKVFDELRAAQANVQYLLDKTYRQQQMILDLKTQLDNKEVY